MIVLSRKQGQTIRISDDIELSIVRVRGHRVIIGIRAAPSIPIHRVDGNSTNFLPSDCQSSLELPSS